MKRLFAFAPLVLVAACATPPGQYTDEQLETRTIVLPQPVPAVLSAFYDSARSCREVGVPDCAPVRPDGTAVCDIYQTYKGDPRPSTVMGRVEFSPAAAGGSSVALRIVKHYGRKDFIFATWEKAARGQPCP